MHIILGVLGIIVTILILLSRLQENGIDIGWLNPFSCHRRRSYRKEHDLNPAFMSDSFVLRNVPYDMRDKSILHMPNFNTVRYGKKSFRYYGSHIWNHLPAEYKAAKSKRMFKNLLKLWAGPNCQCNLCNVLV